MREPMPPAAREARQNPGAGYRTSRLRMPRLVATILQALKHLGILGKAPTQSIL